MITAFPTNMLSAHSGCTTPFSNVDHPHPISYSPIPFIESLKPLSIITIPNDTTHGDKGTQTSLLITPPNCPIHPHHYSTPTFTRQNVNPPNLPSALELWTLLQDPNLVTPIHAHCKLHSPLLTLYRAYHSLIDLKQYPNMQTIRHPIEANLVEALYQLEALTLLCELKRAPSLPKRQEFCRKCYQLGHIKKDCQFYQCPHCHLSWPNHNKEYCLQNPYTLPKEDTIVVRREPSSPPPLTIPEPSRNRGTPPCLTPRHSPQKSNKSSGSSGSSGLVKAYWKNTSGSAIRTQKSINRAIDREFKRMDLDFNEQLRKFSSEQVYNNNFTYDYNTESNISDKPAEYWTNTFVGTLMIKGG